MDIGKELRVIEVEDHDIQDVEGELLELEKPPPQPVDAESKEV